MNGGRSLQGVRRVVRSRAARAALGFVVLAFCAAPVPGDVGGCGQHAQPLDAAAFFEAKLSLDCERCEECRIESQACDEACTAPAPTAFKERCEPLVHDGEVCLRALSAADCSDYEQFMRDEEPAQPTECDFCGGTAP